MIVVKQKVVIEDPTKEDGFEGMILGTPRIDVAEDTWPFLFDIHAAAKYVREHNLTGITDEIMKMFAY